jgi:sec-independent protein translocase protein TatC
MGDGDPDGPDERDRSDSDGTDATDEVDTTDVSDDADTDHTDDADTGQTDDTDTDRTDDTDTGQADREPETEQLEDEIAEEGVDPALTPGGFGAASDPPTTDEGAPATDGESVDTGEPAADDSGEPGVADGGEPGDAGLYSEMDVEDHPPTESTRDGPTDATIEGPPEDEEMPLADHIEEMVRRLGIVVLVMAVVSGVVFPFGDQLINFLWNSVLPGTDVARPRVYHPLALMLARLKVATLAGFVVALPVFVYETYLFMKPGLYPRERKYYLAAVPTSLVLAAVGVAFSFYLVLPFIFTYFLEYSEGAANIAFGLTETFNLIVLMLGTFAFIFQIPLFVMLAIMMGVTTRRWLESRRIYFWGGFLTLAFLFSPDPTGMAPILVAVTMVTLFEGTLALLRWTSRGSLVPTPAEVAGARPYVYALALIAGYLASSAPVPGGYYEQLPAIVRTTLANADLAVATPLLVGGAIIVTYEGLGRYLWRFRNARVILTFRRLRLPVWLAAAGVGYLASPNPVLVQRVDQVALEPRLVAGLVVGIVAVYELTLLAYRFQRRNR